MDINAVRKRLAQLQTTNTRTTNLWKPQPGKTQIRIVPYKLQKESPFIELFFHYDLGGKTYLSPISFGRPDPIEEFADNCRFILTCNFKNRIIQPLHSRCGVYEFNTSKKDMAQLAANFMERVTAILEAEQVEYDKRTVADLIMKFAPDWRRVLNELQRYSVNGNIDSGIVNVTSDKNYDELFSYLKNKDFKKMRAWVVNNIDTDATAIFRAMYDRMSDKVAPQSIPQLVLILADYQYKNAFVADHELNVVACLTEVMSDVQFN